MRGASLVKSDGGEYSNPVSKTPPNDKPLSTLELRQHRYTYFSRSTSCTTPRNLLNNSAPFFNRPALRFLTGVYTHARQLQLGLQTTN